MSFSNDRKVFAKDLDQKLNESLSFVEVYSRYKHHADEKHQTACVIDNCKSSDAFTFYNNCCKCYSCNQKVTNVVHLYMHINNTSNYYEALYNLARDFGVISIEDYNICMNYTNKFSHSKIPSINHYVLDTKKKEKEKKQINTADLKPDKMLNEIYRLIKELCPIKDKEKTHLLNYRALTEDRINQDYFSMPICDNVFYKKLFSEIRNKFGYKPLDLIGIPGFYLDDNGKVRFKQTKGIGFLMSGADNLTRGIHVRAYDNISNTGKLSFNEFAYNKHKKRPKYFWVTSSKLNKGSSCGAPVDVNIPKSKTSKTCFITEGKLKGEIILKTYNSPVISVQGVGNWERKIAPEVKLIEKNYNKLSYMFCAYDADLCFNPKIFRECYNMVKNELINFKGEVRMAFWDYKLGKGLDDVILNGHKDKLKSINFYLFAEAFNKYMEYISNLYPNTTSTKIYDKNNNEVDEETIYDIYKRMVLEPLYRYIEYILYIFPNSTSTKIYDKNNNKVDEQMLYNIFKKMVLEPSHKYAV